METNETPWIRHCCSYKRVALLSHVVGSLGSTFAGLAFCVTLVSLTKIDNNNNNNNNLPIVMHLSIVGPTIPPGAEGGEWWGFDQTSHQISHHLGRLGCQIPS